MQRCSSIVGHFRGAYLTFCKAAELIWTMYMDDYKNWKLKG